MIWWLTGEMVKTGSRSLALNDCANMVFQPTEFAAMFGSTGVVVA